MISPLAPQQLVGAGRRSYLAIIRTFQRAAETFGGMLTTSEVGFALTIETVKGRLSLS